MLHPLCVARHQQLHEILGSLITVGAFNQNIINVLVVDIADSALDQVAVRMDQHWCGSAQRPLPDLVPQTGKIIEIAFDFRLGAGKPGGADDAPHGCRQAEIGNDRLETLAIRCARNLAADAAAMRRVGHQYAVTACKAEIARQRRTLVAAFFLDDLDQQYLAAMDDVLDFVTAAQVHAAGACLFAGLGRIAAAALSTPATIATAPSAVTIVIVTICFGAIFAVLVAMGFKVGFLAFGHVDRVDAVIAVDFDEIGVLVFAHVRTHDISRFVFLGFFLFAQRRFFGSCGSFFGEKAFAVFLRNLVIVGMDFAKGKETMAVAAIIHKRRLKRRLNARHLGEVDIAF